MKRVYILALSTILLCACGSGGDNNNEQPSPSTQNSAPSANAGADVNIEVGEEIILSGSASSDPDGQNLDFLWSIVTSPESSNPTLSARATEQVTFQTDSAGTYEVNLTVSDGALDDSDTIIITVTSNEVNAISADAGAGYSAEEGTDIVLDGSASLAPSGDSLTYKWSILSSPARSNAIVEGEGRISAILKSPSVGIYEIQLEIVNQDGERSTDIASVLIHDYLPIIDPPEHYTAISPHSSTRVIYVSSSLGDDANDGLSSDAPVKSIRRGINLLRDGSPDWLALKSGDTWETGLGGWSKSGSSASAPMVITSYGHGTQRPILKTLNQDALRFQGGGGSPEYADFIAIYGLHFYAASRDPGSEEFNPDISSNSGLVWLRGTRGLLIEDNLFEFYKDAITLQEVDGLDISNVLIKNNVFLDSYNLTGSHAQGIFLKETDHVRIERNIFDHIGWNESVPGAQKTKFNHSIYVQSDNRDIEIVDNIITRSSSHGVQLRSGGLMEGNISIRNSIGLMLGGNSGQGDPGIIKNNIVLQGRDISDVDLLGWGIDLTSGIVSALVENNIVANEMSDSPNPIAIREHALSTEAGNAIYSWGDRSQLANTFVDASRTIASFDATAGGEGTLDSFIRVIRSKSMRAPSEGYEVEDIRKHFADGFAPAQ